MSHISFRYCIIVCLLSLFVVNFLQGAELPAAPEGTFSIVVIPDTQHYFGQGTKREPKSTNPVTNPIFEKWTDWIAANLKSQRVVFVTHVGDIIDLNTRNQWAVARRCMDKLHGKVPYGITVGNHDMVNVSGDSSLFQEFFPKSRFEKFHWYGGCFKNPNGKPARSGNNANSVQLFSAGEMKFVALQIECNAPDDVLAWVDDVLKKHADRRAIITTHMDLGPRTKPKTSRDYFNLPKGRMTWKKSHGKRGNTSQQMWDKCFSKHKNLFMICSGDQSRTQAYNQSNKGEQGNIVHALISDYGKYGIRIMRFIPAKNLIQVQTWNPIAENLVESTSVVPDKKWHQFELKYNMSAK